MKALSLFSGIGGIDLASEWVGIETIAFCEREPFCQKILNKHWPKVPIYDDVCTLTKERLEKDGIGAVDIIFGGYPCQPFSIAGDRQGEDDDRHLWPEVFRLIQEIKPKWFVGENVGGHVTLGLDNVLSDLESIGYPWESFVIPACAVNAPHRRDRVFIVAHSNSVRMERAWAEQQTARTSGESKDVSYTDYKRLQRGKEAGNISSSWEKTEQQSTRHDPFGSGWEIEPNVGRVANGVSHRVDRLKALGNAVVPAQIYPVLAAIKQIDDMMQREEGVKKDDCSRENANHRGTIRDDYTAPISMY